MSLAEWRALLAGKTARRNPALARADLEHLMQRYPNDIHD